MTGNRLSDHRIRAGRVITFTWAFLLLGGIALGIGVLLVSVTRDTGAVVTGSVCLVLGVALAAVFPYRLFTDPQRVELYEDGLRWHKGGQTREAAWADVRELYRKEVYTLQAGAKPSDWNRNSRLRLVFHDGTEVSFNHGLSEYDRLAETAQGLAKDALLPAARESLVQGRVRFGPVTLTPRGLEFKGAADPFAEITRLNVGGGWLSWFTRTGYKREVALMDIPNYLVLLALLEETSAG